MFRTLIAILGLAIGFADSANAQPKFKFPHRIAPRTPPKFPVISNVRPTIPRTAFKFSTATVSQRIVQLRNGTGRAQRVKLVVPFGRSQRTSGWYTIQPNRMASIPLPINADLNRNGAKFRIYVESATGRSWGKNYGGLSGKSWTSTSRQPNGKTITIRYYQFNIL